MTAISVRFKDDQYRHQLKELADFNGETVTTLIRNVALEKLEDEQDYRDAVKADRESNGATVSAEQVMKELGMSNV